MTKTKAIQQRLESAVRAREQKLAAIERAKPRQVDEPPAFVRAVLIRRIPDLIEDTIDCHARAMRAHDSALRAVQAATESSQTLAEALRWISTISTETEVHYLDKEAAVLRERLDTLKLEGIERIGTIAPH